MWSYNATFLAMILGLFLGCDDFILVVDVLDFYPWEISLGFRQKFTFAKQ